jgi:hypothetical protein
MTAAPCKACGQVHGRLSATRRGRLYRQLFASLAQWALMAAAGMAPPVITIEQAGSQLGLILADDQGLCVACADEVVLP